MHLTVILRKEGKWIVAWTPDLDVASQGRDEAEALDNLKEAVELYLEDTQAPRPVGHPLVTTLDVPEQAAA